VTDGTGYFFHILSCICNEICEASLIFYRFALMEHVLDNPAWNALISGNKHLSNSNEQVRYFDKEVSPFAAFRENSADNFQLLYDMLPHNGPVLFVTPIETEIPAQWKVTGFIKGLQMVYEGPLIPQVINQELIPLT